MGDYLETAYVTSYNVSEGVVHVLKRSVIAPNTIQAIPIQMPAGVPLHNTYCVIENLSNPVEGFDVPPQVYQKVNTLLCANIISKELNSKPFL